MNDITKQLAEALRKMQKASQTTDIYFQAAASQECSKALADYEASQQLDEQALPPLPIEWRKVEDADGIEVPVFRAFQMRDYALTTLQQPADPPPAHGDINGRNDGLRPALHGLVAAADCAPGALADLLWASPDVMGLNAELGLTMHQLVQLAQALSKAIPDVQPKVPQQLPVRDEREAAETCEGSLCMQTNRCSYSPCQSKGSAVANYKPGSWFKAQSVDEMQAFFLSRLPAIREAARKHGYAIGVHGSQRRDFDLIAAPWRDEASDPDTLAHAVMFAACGLTRDGAWQWTQKPLGRLAVSIPICWTPPRDVKSDGHIDLSVCAALPQPAPEAAKGVPSEPVALRDFAERVGIRMDCWDMGAASMAYSEGCQGITRAHLERLAEMVGVSFWNAARKLEREEQAAAMAVPAPSDVSPGYAEYMARFTPPAPEAQQAEPFAWATFDGEGGFDLRLYEDNESYRDDYIKRNGEKYASWVIPLYDAQQPAQAVPLSDQQRKTLFDEVNGLMPGLDSPEEMFATIVRFVERSCASAWGVKLPL